MVFGIGARPVNRPSVVHRLAGSEERHGRPDRCHHASGIPAKYPPSIRRGLIRQSSLSTLSYFCVHRVDRDGLYFNQEVSSLSFRQRKFDVGESSFAVAATGLLKYDGVYVFFPIHRFSNRCRKTVWLASIMICSLNPPL